MHIILLPTGRPQGIAPIDVNLSTAVILSAAKDLSPTEILRCAQDDTPEAASFDSQNVFFEMY